MRQNSGLYLSRLLFDELIGQTPLPDICADFTQNAFHIAQGTVARIASPNAHPNAVFVKTQGDISAEIIVPINNGSLIKLAFNEAGISVGGDLTAKNEFVSLTDPEWPAKFQAKLEIAISTHKNGPA